MELEPPLTRLDLTNTSRLVASRYPTVGILDQVASPEDLQAVLDLESWTNDRISNELGTLFTIPAGEWVVGVPNANAVMAAFCHPHPAGGRFNGPERGAWYAAFDQQTGIRESVFRRTQEFAEIGSYEGFVQMREYLADFSAPFHDVRGPDPEFRPLHDPDSYAASQALAERLLHDGSNGVAYHSVRRPEGECLACFRPRLVLNVRQGDHFEYRWHGTPEPTVRRLRL
jgi:hypothetical protein